MPSVHLILTLQLNQVEVLDLAEKLAILLRDHALRKRMGAEGQQAAWEKFSAERMVAATLEVFQQLVKEKSTLH